MRAVVVGAGFSGLLAAAALRSRVDEVVVVERDSLPEQPRPRRGVPQSLQLHNILGRAQRHTEQLLPGFKDRLSELGCGRGTASTDTYVFELGVRMPERDVGLEILSALRPTADSAALSLLDGSVTILDRSSVVALLGESRSLVTGVRVERKGKRLDLPADLLVDASGPSAMTARWLSGAGVTVPTLEHRSDQWYVCVEVRPVGVLDRPHFTMVFPSAPRSRGGLMSPMGDGRYYVSLNGRSVDPIPRSLTEMVEYARTLEDPVIANRLSQCVAVGDPRVFHKQVATWRRFDRVPMPRNLAVLGDAVAALNPLFGQGMSGAAWQASVLRDVTFGDDFASEFASRTAAIVQHPWSLGEVVAQSLRVEGSDGPLDLSSALGSLVAEDPELHRRYVRIWHLLEPASVLAEPPTMRRLLERASRHG